MRIALVFGLNCPASSDGGGLKSLLGTRLIKLGHVVSFHAWDEPRADGVEFAVGHSYGGYTVAGWGIPFIGLDPVPHDWITHWNRLGPIPTTAPWFDVWLRPWHGWLPLPSQKVYATSGGFGWNQVFPGVGHNDMRSNIKLHDEIVAAITLFAGGQK